MACRKRPVSARPLEVSTLHLTSKWETLVATHRGFPHCRSVYAEVLLFFNKIWEICQLSCLLGTVSIGYIPRRDETRRGQKQQGN